MHPEHPVLCVDGKMATFLDDAFSLSPETGEILVHVVDVAGKHAPPSYSSLPYLHVSNDYITLFP